MKIRRTAIVGLPADVDDPHEFIEGKQVDLSKQIATYFFNCYSELGWRSENMEEVDIGAINYSVLDWEFERAGEEHPDIYLGCSPDEPTRSWYVREWAEDTNQAG